ncbi:MAG: hypothetical protein A2020_14885 [Lentisphaerae bacterium GWF2_45_14]|nr:MAG: hypothetical protein A2020_14885 [Lentisphaerae bacterium GWF2_45_14]
METVQKKGCRILVVDDNPENIRLTGTILRDNGFLVSIASDGNQALKIMQRNLPDLILLDIIMPEMDGFETCKRLKDNPVTKDIPIIFMSALIETVDKVKGFNAGGVDYLTKPADPEEMLARINTHLTMKFLYRKLEEINKNLEETVRVRTIELIQKNKLLSEEIDQRKEAEEALRKSKDDLSITLNSIGDAVVAVDAEGNVTMMNPVAEKLMGVTFTIAEGKPLKDVFDIVNATRESLENPLEKVMKGEKRASISIDTTLVSKDGKEYLIADSCAPIRNPEEKIVGAVLVFRDITEKHRLEEQLRQAQKMESIGQLAGGIAHDFNNLLAGIFGYSQALSRKLKDNDALREYSDGITDTAKRAADLIRKLMAFSRKGKLVSIITNVNNSIKEVAAILERSIDKRIKLNLDLNAENPVVMGDPSLLQNAILNLGINARDAMPEGGKLTIATKNTVMRREDCQNSSFDLKPGSYIEIVVSDTGIGMGAETQRHIFEPFFTTKQIGQGTGLGLASVYGTVKAHYGAITVYSNLGDGATFNLYLPMAEKPPAGEVLIAEDAIVRGSGCVLLVDDERVIRTTGCELLEGLGYEVLLASNGMEALRVLKDNIDKIDLVILDMVMPEMNGRDCFHEIRKIDPDAKVLISSGFTQFHELNGLFSEGLRGYIRKPFTVSELSKAVDSAMKGFFSVLKLRESNDIGTCKAKEGTTTSMFQI